VVRAQPCEDDLGLPDGADEDDEDEDEDADLTAGGPYSANGLIPSFWTLMDTEGPPGQIWTIV
jgi:hypothetical protein